MIKNGYFDLPWKQCTYVNGKKEGLCIRWDDKYKTISTYKNGKLNGECEKLEPGTDDLVEKCTYKDGKLDGLYQKWYWYKNILIEKRTYDDGKIIGLYQKWNKKGKPIVDKWYVDGEEVLEYKLKTMLEINKERHIEMNGEIYLKKPTNNLHLLSVELVYEINKYII